jgi:hypothetical protein
MVNQLKDFRAGRLSRESLILPPTFYWTFGLLSIFITISFTLREAADPNSEFSIVDRCFFSTLTLAFLTLFRFAIDMNYPFKGQHRPSSRTFSASCLLSTSRTYSGSRFGFGSPFVPLRFFMSSRVVYRSQEITRSAVAPFQQS